MSFEPKTGAERFEDSQTLTSPEDYTLRRFADVSLSFQDQFCCSTIPTDPYLVAGRG